jgi:hypothetical protein
MPLSKLLIYRLSDLRLSPRLNWVNNGSRSNGTRPQHADQDAVRDEAQAGHRENHRNSPLTVLTKDTLKPDSCWALPTTTASK